MSVVKKTSDFDDTKKLSILSFFIQNKIVIIGCILVFIVIGVLVVRNTINNNEVQKELEEQNRYNNLPMKVDISMTNYYGSIEYILYELDLDFDMVTSGANCYSGIQKREFKTDKYGLLYTEFSYCKSNKTTVFRVYNSEKDQELRDPKPGELPSFDKYGEKNAKSDL